MKTTSQKLLAKRNARLATRKAARSMRAASLDSKLARHEFLCAQASHAGYLASMALISSQPSTVDWIIQRAYSLSDRLYAHGSHVLIGRDGAAMSLIHEAACLMDKEKGPEWYPGQSHKVRQYTAAQKLEQACRLLEQAAYRVVGDRACYL